MSYDSDFYKAYEAYLNEPRVRQQHDRMLDLYLDPEYRFT